MSRSRVEPSCPQLGDAELEQRQRTQIVAESALGRVRRLSGSQQPTPLRHHRPQISPVTRDRQPQDREHELQLVAAIGWV